MILMLTRAWAVALLTARIEDASLDAGGSGRGKGEMLAAIKMSGPIITGTIMQCDPDGYQPVYYCSKMDRSPLRRMPVASGGRLC
jgi:hypothetical protein